MGTSFTLLLILGFLFFVGKQSQNRRRTEVVKEGAVYVVQQRPRHLLAIFFGVLFICFLLLIGFIAQQANP